MKTKIFNFVAPMAFVALGLVGAFSTNAMEKKAAESGIVLGYRKVVGGTPPCQPADFCDEVPTHICRASSDSSPLYRYISDTQCPQMLFRSTP